MGCSLDLKDFCKKVVTTTLRLVESPKACSIFIVRKDKSFPINPKRFYGISSTGFFEYNQNVDGDGIKKLFINDQAWEEAFYEIVNDGQPPLSITKWVITNKSTIVIDDVYSESELNDIPSLCRGSGKGKYSEVVVVKGKKVNNHEKTGSMMYMPILSRDGNIVIGIIRISKKRDSYDENKKNKNLFSDYEITTLTSYKIKLSKVIANIFFMGLLDQIRNFNDLNQKLKFVVKETIAIIGGRGCSIFLFKKLNETLEFSATYGTLEGKKINPYSLGTGYTGWVGKYRLPFWFNKREEFKFLEEIGDIPAPKWSKRINECEAESLIAEKFAAVPILSDNKELLGVIRVAKIESDTDITLTEGAFLNCSKII